MTAEAAEEISQVQCLMTATAGWEVVSGHFYSQQRPDQVFNSCLFLRNTSGTFSAWCSNQPRLPYTSTKWGWCFRNTPFVNSRHSSRKGSLTTAAMGLGRAGGDRGTTTAVPSRRSGPSGAGQPPRQPPASSPVRTQCLSVGPACFACWWCLWRVTITVPLWLNRGLSPIVLPSPAVRWMWLEYLGFSETSQHGTSQSEWLTRLPLNDFHLVWVRIFV